MRSRQVSVNVLRGKSHRPARQRHQSLSPPLAAGLLIGGYAGQRLARHRPVTILRVIVALAGLAPAVKLGLSAYR
jgi:uncharacterized membrane protein YfcA